MGSGDIHTAGSARKIARLADNLVNQIAAGEVVERPASAVKELVENALDAGATRIDVLLRDGGIGEISVIDNGCGMGPEDLRLSVERHATSKIRTAEDLEAIGTFGFRGEALSSIASVSEMELRSRTNEMPNAFALSLAYGTWDGDLKPAGAPLGTAITIRNLFQRVPARQKFLKSFSTEFSHCSKTLKEVALGNPATAFYLHHQGTQVARYVSPTRETRLRECLKVTWEPLAVREETEAMRLEAFLSPPHHTQNRGDLYLYINGRCVRNRPLLSAVRGTYLDTLGPHHEPSGAVFLDIRKDWVDVNVHPQKWEVRCLRQEALYPWLVAALRKAISREGGQAVRPAVGVGWSPSQTPSARAPWAATVIPSFRGQPFAIVQEKSLIPEPGPLTSQVARSWRYLGQIKAAYLLCEVSNGVVLVDQHTLHEKLVFDRITKTLEGGPVNGQRLLSPKVIRLPVSLRPLFDVRFAEYGQMGFEMENFGDGDIAVKSRPEVLKETEIEVVLIESLNAMQAGQLDPDPIVSAIARHSVVKTGQVLSPREAEHLLEGLEEIAVDATGPHGHPVFFRVNFDSMDKHFERT